jgi:hypothetical protein
MINKFVELLCRPRNFWTTKVQVYEGDPLTPSHIEEVFSTDNTKAQFKFEIERTAADPFLLVAGGRLWLFIEKQYCYGRGEIALHSSADLKHWTNHGTVLAEPFHLSFPQVFIHEQGFYMIPEAVDSGAVWLYKSRFLEGGWVKHAKLIDRPLADPVHFESNGHHYIWATDLENKLRLYHSSQLSGPYQEHPSSPVTIDRRYSRCAGAILKLDDGRLVRLAQDGSEIYGSAISALEIKKLSPDVFEEALLAFDFIPRKETWNVAGVHHFHTVIFKGKKVRTLDGLSPSIWLNYLPLVPIRIYNVLTRLWGGQKIYRYKL